MKFHTLYRRPNSVGLVCPEHSLTEQVYKDQCDLNFLIRKYHLEDDPFQLRMMIDPDSRAAEFLDTTQVPDIYTALHEHQRVKMIFESLDYQIQKRFDFSVDAFAEFCLTAPVKDVEALHVPNLAFSKAVQPVSSSSPDVTPSKQETSPEA